MSVKQKQKNLCVRRKTLVEYDRNFCCLKEKFLLAKKLIVLNIFQTAQTHADYVIRLQ